MITEAQYESLFAFCRKHYVQYYDVQVELVDHLSAAIEEKMKENPKLSFEEALDKVYAGFGVKGFADIVATREQMVSKQCRKQKWKLFFSYFTVPKIAMTLCIYGGMLLIGRWLTQEFQKGIFLSILGLAVFVFEVLYTIQMNRLFKSQKKPLIYTSERIAGVIHSGLFLQIFISNRIFDYAMSFISYAMISLFILVIFISILAHRDFVKELHRKALTQYPKAFAQ